MRVLLLAAGAVAAALLAPAAAPAWQHCRSCYAVPVAVVAAPAAQTYAVQAYAVQSYAVQAYAVQPYAVQAYAVAPTHAYLYAPLRLGYAPAAPVAPAGVVPQPTGPVGSPITTADDTARAIGDLKAALSQHASTLDRLTTVAARLTDGQAGHEARLTAIEKKLAAMPAPSAP